MPFSRPFSCISRPALWLAALLLAFSPVLPAQAAQPAARPRFHATFLQLWTVHDSYTEAQWDDLCQNLKAMRVEEIILQWSLITDPPFFWRLKEGRREQVPHDRVEPAPAVRSLVRAAEGAGLRVRFGLTHDPGWWGKINNGPQLVEVYLNRLWQDQSALARSLVEAYGSSPCFGGFYIPQEIDDHTWLDPDKGKLLTAHFRRLTACLRQLKPGASVAVSCFFNGRDDPDHAGRFWQGLLGDAALDLLYVQDGIGAGKLDWDEISLYMQALSRATAGTKAGVRAIVELFRKSDAAGRDTGEPALHAGFHPAPMARIARQMAQADRLLGPWIIAFSLPEYATPMGGTAAEALGREYRAYLQGR